MGLKKIVFLVLALLWAVLASAQRCVDGMAGSFPCNRVDLVAFVPLAELGAGNARANDLWGWTDPGSGREFVLLGLTSGTVFVEITNPSAPVYLGTLRTRTTPSGWRDIKVYKNHAFIVSEAFGHGMQIFDLPVLLEARTPPVELTAVAHYSAQEFGTAHNLAINEDTGFAYVVGSDTCSFGLHMVNIQNPRQPAFAGCFGGDGYTHDAQCVLYDGPDSDYRGREVCFAYNEDTLTIVDVANKGAPRMISRTSYPGVAYTHQGWVTEDHLYLLLGDELDEQVLGHNTKTRIWDIVDLDRPLLIGTHEAQTASIDHNMYVHRGVLYQSNYTAGLRLYRLDAVADGRLIPAGFFDVYPADDAPVFNGTWSVYPFFDSGVVALSERDKGLFLLDPRDD